VLRFEHVSFQYAAGQPNAALDVALELRAGELCALLGPSGCGKSTLLKLGAGLLVPARGIVLIEGAPPDPKRRPIGYIPQDLGLLDWFSVLSNAALGPRVRGDPRAEEKAEAALVRLGILELKSRYPATLSGGQRQRVALARALAMDAKLLLMDEPFSALDALAREEAQTYLRSVASERRLCVLLVTHSIEEAAALGSRIAVMEAGRLKGLLDNPLAHEPDPRGAPGFQARCTELRAQLAEDPQGEAGA